MQHVRCPKCDIRFQPEEENDVYMDKEDGIGRWWIRSESCPECQQVVILLGDDERQLKGVKPYDIALDSSVQFHPVYPKSTNRAPVPPEVPDEFARDYVEACMILADSPRASAALSRLCLERILVEKSGVTGVTGKNLKQDIERVATSNSLPTSISELLDAPRQLGNMAVHAKRDSATGTVVPVEPWEARWCLEIIEALFEHYFVAPNKNAARLKRLQEKIDQAI